MIYVLLGPSCSGKTTILQSLKSIGVSTVVSYTTRPIRLNEKDGYDYNFVTEEEYAELDKDGKMILKNSFISVYGTTWYYGVHKDSLKLDEDVFMITEMNGFAELQELFGKENVFGILLNVSNKTLMKRGLARNDDKNELKRRLKRDAEDFKNSASKVQMVLNAEGDFVLDDILRIIGGNPI